MGLYWVGTFLVYFVMLKEPPVAHLFPVLVLQRSLNHFQLLEQSKLIEFFCLSAKQGIQNYFRVLLEHEPHSWDPF